MIRRTWLFTAVAALSIFAMPHRTQAETPEGWKVFKGAFFEVGVPPGFIAKPVTSNGQINTVHLVNKALSAWLVIGAWLGSGILLALCIHNIRAGNLWIEAIAEALQKCRMVLFVKSKHSLDSIYCLNELMVAFEANKAILPVCIDAAPLLLTFKLLHGTTQNVDACHKPDSALFA